METTTTECFLEVVTEATNTATYAAADILYELLVGNQTIKQLLSQDIDEAIYTITVGDVDGLQDAMNDRYEEIFNEVLSNFIEHINLKL